MKYIIILLLITAGVQAKAQKKYDAIAEQAAKETDQKMTDNGLWPDTSLNIDIPPSKLKDSYIMYIFYTLKKKQKA